MQYFTIYQKSPNNVKADKVLHADVTSEFVKKFMSNNVNSYNAVVKTTKVVSEVDRYNHKLQLWNNGDRSVGIQGDNFEVDVPFDVDDCSWDMLEDFREAMRTIYQEYTDSKMFADYKYETKFRDEQ